MQKVIGIIGFGNMGSAIAARIKSKYKVAVFDQDKNKTAGLREFPAAGSARQLVDDSEAVILAVKPQEFGVVLSEIKEYLKDKLVISIAAGIATADIERVIGRVRLIRAMPNAPAKIGAGITCLCPGKFAAAQDFSFAEGLFGLLGKTLRIEEKMMNAATAVSGSGPGYLYHWAEGKTIAEARNYAREVFAPGLAAAAVNLGFSTEQAQLLARATAEGSIVFLESSRLSPAELKKQVASRGGTTEAGLGALERGGSLEEAVRAAAKRAEELFKKE